MPDSTTLILRAPLGTPANIELRAPNPAAPDAQVVFYANDPHVTPTTIILRAAGDGVTSHREAALTGLRATTFWNCPLLAGMRATTSQGVLSAVPSYQFFLDTFTDTNGTTVTTHITDIPGSTWAETVASTEPTIQSNRARGAGTGVGLWVGAIGGYADTYDNRFFYEGVFFRRATSTGVAANTISEGLTIRDQFFDGSELYAFGWCENDDTWYLKRRNSGTWTHLANSVVGAFTGTSQSRTLRWEVVDTASSVDFRCYVDGVLIITYSDTSGSRITGDTTSNMFGFLFNGSGSVDIDSLNTQAYLNVPLGQRATTSQGVLDGFGYPFGPWLNPGLRATTAAGVLSVGAGSASAGLTGIALALTQGALGQQLGVGTTTTTAVNTIAPTFTVTDHRTTPNTFGSGNDYKLGSFRGAFLPTSEGLSGAGEGYTDTTNFTTFLQYHWRLSHTYINRATHSTTVNSYSTPIAKFDTEVMVAGSLGRYFSPNSSEVGYAVDPTQGYFYRSSSLQGGFASADPDGNFQAAWPRNWVYQSSRTEFLAWQIGPWTADYPGQPFIVGRTGTGDTEINGLSLGLYAVSKSTALAFYSRRTNTGITGVNTKLAGFRITATRGTLTAAVSGSGLVGLRATTAQGVVARDGSQAGVNVVVGLTGLGTTAQVPGAPTAVNTNDVLGFAMRKGTDHGTSPTTWSDEVLVTAVSGVSVLRAAGSVCVVPTGVGDVVYAVYTSTSPLGTQLVATVIDASSLTVLGNVAVTAGSAVTYAFSAQRTNSNQQRFVAEVVKLESGTSFTQFTLDDRVVHLMWTVGGVTAPTLTAKSPPGGSMLRGWETLEIRGDAAYHVFYTAVEGVGYTNTVVVNDATGTGSTWNSATAVVTGDTTPINASPSYTDGDRYSGYGGGKDSWLFVEYVSPHSFDKTVFGDSVVWIDFWKTQPTLLSVSAKGVVGHVTISNTPNVALVGLRATLSQGLFTNIISGNDRSIRPVGRRATTGQGQLSFSTITFLLDTFTDAGSTHLLVHAGEIGMPWLGDDQYHIISNEARPIVNGSSGSSWATGVSPTRDYKATTLLTTSGIGTHIGGVPELAIGVRCNNANGTGDGYYFGYNPVEANYYLYKPNSWGDTAVMVVGASALSGEMSIEVNGVNPTRIICRIGGVTWCDVLDTGHQYYDPGVVVLFTAGFSAFVGSFIHVNATYYDPGALIIDGQRATTGQGQLVVAGGLTGLRATTAQGVIDPSTPTTNVNLTGLTLTTAQGVIFPVQGVGVLVGQALTLTQGSITPPTFVLLAGLRATLYGGQLVPLTGALFGLRATLVRGDLGVVVTSSQALTGFRLNTAGGLLTSFVDVSLLGRLATTGYGVVGTATAAPGYSSGAAGTTGAGILTPSVQNTSALTGRSATTTGGALVPSTAETAAFTGLSTACAIGTLVPVLSTGVAGARATTGAGVMVPLTAVTVLGRAAVSAAGVMQVLTNISLTGRSGVVSAGSLTPSHGCTVYPTGVWATGAVGDVTRSFPPVAEGEKLWIVTRAEELDPNAPSEDEFVVKPP